jgi:hypothetical protein
LVIDDKRGRAYTHLWEGSSVSLDLRKRSIVGRWTNGCSGSRGIALDEQRGFLFVGCSEGKAVVLDVEHDGKQLSSASTGAGVDIIDYDAQRGHLYFAAAKDATLTILSVSAKGALAVLGTFPAAKDSLRTTDGNGPRRRSAGGSVDRSHGHVRQSALTRGLFATIVGGSPVRESSCRRGAS